MRNESTQGALGDHETLQAWKRTKRRITWALISCLFSLFVLPFLALAAWQQVVEGMTAVPLIIVLAPALFWTVVVSLRWDQVKAVRPILETYAWQAMPAAPKRHEAAAKEKFKIPNPDNPAKNVDIVARRSTVGTKWKRTVTAAADEGFMFAGDPRFRGVIALRGLDHLVVVRPRQPFLNHSGRPDEVSQRAWQLAVAAKASGTLWTTEKLDKVQQMEGKGGPNA